MFSQLEDSSQILMVLTESWESVEGTLQRFEKNERGQWEQVGSDICAVVGKNGMGWGLGRHAPVDPEIIKKGPVKQEGDGKAPAGIFNLGTTFGHTAAKHVKQKIKMPYLEIHPWTEAIGDSASRFYNQILDTRDITDQDWDQQENEQMGLIPLYLRGVVIHHNQGPNTQPHFGSNIFLHIWRSPNQGTAGCTAVSPKDMDILFYSLDSEKNPLIIQFPKVIQPLIERDWELTFFLP